jgi:hemerythrin-like domain-containing protein
MCMSEPVFVNPLRQILPVGHLLRRLADMHDELHQLLDRLERVASEPGRGSTPEGVLDALCLLHYVGRKAHALTRREELVLFAALEAEGEQELTAELRAEHTELEAMRARLIERGNTALDEPAEVESLRADLRAYVWLARGHLRRELHLVVPFALEVVSEE